MPTKTGLLRKRLMTPSPVRTRMEKRGFRPTSPDRQQLLETIGRTFLLGYGHGMAGADSAEVAAGLATVDRDYRGFAYEGCAMALTIRDALAPWPTTHARDIVAGTAVEHPYLAHIGTGWAMAKLPQLRWGAVIPADPLLRWLALDGYGFHQAYFKTSKYVDGQYVAPRLSGWTYTPSYVDRAVDQGIGRAMWFVNGADPERAAAAIGAFAPSRRADLWSGAGLATTYAGGVDIAGLEAFAAASGEYRPDVAQAAAFAAKTRLRTDLVTAPTETAVKVYCGMTVVEAAAVTDEEQDGLPRDGRLPAYEVWRQRIRSRFV